MLLNNSAVEGGGGEGVQSRKRAVRKNQRRQIQKNMEKKKSSRLQRTAKGDARFDIFVNKRRESGVCLRCAEEQE